MRTWLSAIAFYRQAVIDFLEQKYAYDDWDEAFTHTMQPCHQIHI